MGVHGLWRLIEPSGKPVPLETLENKVLAVDVSIWLHQLVKGFQDSKGAPVPNAHLLGIYHRICKLLYFRIKPVFVFDGGVPVLKKQTMAKRHQQKSKTVSEVERIHRNLLTTLLKHSAVSKVLSEKTKAALSASLPATKTSPKQKDDDIYVLSASTSLNSTLSCSEDDEESTEDSTSTKNYDLHSIDTESAQFKALPADIRHEILTDLKETRKQSSWGRLHELPTESDDFATYQMKRLLKRQAVQTALEDVEKEMGGHTLSLGELEKILKDQGVISNTNIKGNRIASDENTRFLLIKDIKQAVEEAKKQNNALATITETDEEGGEDTEKDSEKKKDHVEVIEKAKNKADVEFEEDLEKAIALSLEETPSTSRNLEVKGAEEIKGDKSKYRMPLSFLEGFTDADFFDNESSEDDELTPLKLTPVKRYMMEYSGLTAHEISRIIPSKRYLNRRNKDEKIVINDENIVKGKHLEFNRNEQSGKSVDVLLLKGDETIIGPIADFQENENVEMVSQEDKKENENKDAPLERAPTIEKEINQTKEETIKEHLKSANEAMDVSDKEMKEKDSEVEIMSDSSSDDDFVEVEEKTKEESIIPSMEVVIKLDEEPEDDLFKDIFEYNPNEESQNKNEITTEGHEFVVEKTMPMTPQKSKSTEGIEKVFAKEITSEKGRPNIPNLYDKINKVIKNYSSDENREKPELSVETMEEMQRNLNKEHQELIVERSNKERLAGNITEQMYQEAQELLELFGVPYLIAPMEAEAQCAFLDLINLTDGTITDDSDIWLFGGRTVYKNFFNQSKTVLEFKSDNIQHHFKLTREQMILLAMLVGSDYTIGISGVGPVTALEILAAFPPKNQLLSGLMEFKSWFTKGKLPGPSRTTLRNKLKNVSFTENFPNPQIAEAYLEPRVETSEEKFTWAKPDVVGLVDFARQKFGWTRQKTEEILTPILKRLEEHRKQKTITDFYKIQSKIDSGETEARMSKRVKTAIKRIGKGGGSASDEEESLPKKKKATAKREKKDKSFDEKSKEKKDTKKRFKGTIDKDVKVLKKTEVASEKRLEEIHKEIQKKINEVKEKRPVNFANLRKREVIPQKQKDKSDMLKNKLKAIETFRKSKQGPGHVKKKGKIVKAPKEDASYLSEESSDSN